MSSQDDAVAQFEARIAAHEHLIRHLVVTVLARSEDPQEALEGFQKRLTAPLRRPPPRDTEDQERTASDGRVLEIVDWISKNIREDIQHALSQLAGRRK